MAARRGEPVWEIAELLPEQGYWSERQYLSVSLHSNRVVEFDDGVIEVLPPRTRTHQIVMGFLFTALDAFVRATERGGVVFFLGYRLRIPTQKFREPDVFYLTAEQMSRAGEEYTSAAELVMEVVSPDDPHRDYVAKREDYAAAGVPEYWVVDEALRQILVLRLEQGAYVEHGRFGPGDRATSHRLAPFSVDVDEVLSQGATPT